MSLLNELELELISYEDGLNVGVPRSLPILPLRNSVIFPGMVTSLSVGREKSLHMLKKMEGNFIGILTQKDQKTDDPVESDLYRIGTISKVIKAIQPNADSLHIIVQGLVRFKIKKFLYFEPHIAARVFKLHITKGELSELEMEGLMHSLKESTRQVFELTPAIPKEASLMISGITNPDHLADLVASNLDISVPEKQVLLETLALKKRLPMVLRAVVKQLEVLKVSDKIHSQVKEEIDKTQQEYYLRQQLKAIKEKLGELSGEKDETTEMSEKIGKAKMSLEAEKIARKELDRLKSMQMASAEYTVARTYLETLIELPWSVSTEDVLDIKRVRDVLNKDHFNLDKVKKRIIEFIAVRKLNPQMKGPILCLVGPPGVGKTSLGMSIAKAMGRKFFRCSLGGVHDEAEIRGHRRTYIGSMPGRIIQGIKKVGTHNPVFMLDEIDKIGSDFRGDPSSALLEVLDPEQNFSFSDNYLDVPFNLSTVLFIATANILDPVPPALKDRLEILELHGYIPDEKIAIAEKFLIPKQMKEHGLTEKQVQFSRGSLSCIIHSYTREAGVRNLERNIASICRGVAVKVAEGNKKCEVINERQVENYLGPEQFFPEIFARTNEKGIAIGLAWTPFGGDIIFIETTRMQGKGKLKLTGKLGEVMKESAETAVSYVRSRSKELNIPEETFESVDIHIHFPSGSIPKDGPSAGITICTALISLLTGIKVEKDIAMTGEMTLRGLVLPVGGIKEKVLAAHRYGLKRIILPLQNKKDLQEIPDKVKEEIQFHLVETFDQVLKLAFKKQIPSKQKG